jgi:hypothetical protein
MDSSSSATYFESLSLSRKLASTSWTVGPRESQSNLFDVAGTISLAKLLIRVDRYGGDPGQAGLVSFPFPASAESGVTKHRVIGEPPTDQETRRERRRARFRGFSEITALNTWEGFPYRVTLLGSIRPRSRHFRCRPSRCHRPIGDRRQESGVRSQESGVRS